jgi:hypothetical protein
MSIPPDQGFARGAGPSGGDQDGWLDRRFRIHDLPPTKNSTAAIASPTV